MQKKLLALLISLLFVTMSVGAVIYKVVPEQKIDYSKEIDSPVPTNMNPPQVIEIIWDTSMDKYFAGTMKTALKKVLETYASTTAIGIRYVGTPMSFKNILIPDDVPGMEWVSGSCLWQTLKLPVAQHSKQELENVLSVPPNTSRYVQITAAIYRAVNQDMTFYYNQHKKIILITNGKQLDGGDVCKYTNYLMSQRNDVTIDVYVPDYGTTFACLTRVTSGKFYVVNSSPKKLLEEMQKSFSVTSIQPEPQPKAKAVQVHKNKEQKNE